MLVKLSSREVAYDIAQGPGAPSTGGQGGGRLKTDAIGRVCLTLWLRPVPDRTRLALHGQAGLGGLADLSLTSSTAAPALSPMLSLWLAGSAACLLESMCTTEKCGKDIYYQAIN